MSRAPRRLPRASLALALAPMIALAGCSAGADERVVGKQWQVTGIFDDPALPASVPEGVVPPLITFGGRSYTLETGCGSYQGKLKWRDEGIVSVGDAERTREMECDAPAATIDERFRAAVAGEFMVGDPRRDLRMTAIGDHSAGEAAPGWAAITREL